MCIRDSLNLMIKRINERIQRDEQTKKELQFATIPEEQNFSCLLCNETLPTQAVLANHLQSFRHKKRLRNYFVSRIRRQIRKKSKDPFMSLLKRRGLIKRVRTKYEKLRALSLKCQLAELLSHTDYSTH
eukprot:TRINITY_DN11627_c0_g1_i2.p1 TRINITY_DN11627_c0_g1~~TRINITY_DN11627_c0_g1_i2.p1  ORF type:complete len:129 (-),score=28.81 TRINITY_DN11627_c0_g1_i2:116-502(-)